MTIFQFALKRSFRNKTNLLFLTLFPVGAVFLPASEMWPFLPFGYHYFGVLLLFVSIRLASIMLEDRAKGVVKRLAVAPISHLHYLWQNLLAYMVILLFQCALVVGGGVLYGQELYSPFALFFLFVTFSLTSLAFALAWISLFRNKETSFLVFMSIVVLIALLGGVIMPIEMMPAVFERLAVIFPTYWLLSGMKWIALGGQTTDILLIHGMLLLYTVCFLIIGSIRKIA